MVKLNKNLIKDKIYACWIGKNIGGTFGGPYETARDILDIKDFKTAKGEVLPNDDLDLQLVWLRAIEECGPYNLTPQLLGEYWLNYIPPHWNEYGVARNNMTSGLIPPISGELNNEKWKNSNGAWIRSEIWACLTPGFPNLTMKYAYMDACIDHGYGEGLYAEVFTATMESIAFFESDIRKIIDSALNNIPSESRLAKCINIVLDGYDAKKDWKEVRNSLVEFCSDIGWFQAPTNVAYVILGLLYGEGDFKKSMTYAVNCGDDTDCTASTVGSFLGILYGTAGIPDDWREYVGDKIITKALNGDMSNKPDNCFELTERVMCLIPTMLLSNAIKMEYTDDISDISYTRSDGDVLGFSWQTYDKCLFDIKDIYKRAPYSIEAFDTVYASGILEMDKAPIMKAGETIKLTLRIKNKMTDPKYMHFNVYAPEGWTVNAYQKTMYLGVYQELCRRDDIHCPPSEFEWTVTITAGENVEKTNRVIIDIGAQAHCVTVPVGVTLLG